MLQIRELSKKYGNVKALSQFSYTFEYGIYGILGINGAGKSTLFQLITDNIARESGEILYKGSEIRKLGKHFRKKVGYLPQQQGFYPQLSARQFLGYMGSLKGISKKKIDEEVCQWLEKVGLGDVADQKLGNFSGGMRQRALLAQALLGEPEIIILDEPTSGLDPKERIRMRNFISDLGRNHCILLATHVVTDVECIAKEVLMMKRGKLVKVGTPQSIIHEMEGMVKECYCVPEEMERIQKEYGMGNIYQREEGQVLRIVGNEIPTGYKMVDVTPTLEDGFLFYAN